MEVTPKSYSGKERRLLPIGRRSNDGQCVQHDFIQEVTKARRRMIDEAIGELKMDIRGLMSWKVFTFLAMFSVMVVGSGFGFFGVKIDKLDDQQVKATKEITKSLTDIVTSQAVMLSKFGEIETRTKTLEDRQNVLRDASIKHLTDEHKK